MASVFTLLSLPQTSNGFTSLRPTAVANSPDDGSASTSRKVPRLDTDSDSATASRSKVQTQTKVSKGPIKIQIIGGGRNVKPVQADTQLNELRHCIRTILTKEHPDVIQTTNEAIYNTCRSIVTVEDKGEGLYEILKLELERCGGELSKILNGSDVKGIDWISQFVDICEWFTKQTNLLKSLLTYLDQVYIIKTANASRIQELAFSTFNIRIFGNPNIHNRLRAEIKAWVNWERSSRLEHEKRDKIPLLIHQLFVFDQYPFFEEHYVYVARKFYLEESETLAEEMKDDAPGFFKCMKSRLDEELKRAQQILPASSWGMIRKATQEVVWMNRVEWLANENVSFYMKLKDIDKLGSMYALFSRVGGTKALCTSFKKFIQTSVAEIVQDQQQDEMMVQRLLDLKALADHSISTAFVDELEEPLSITTSDPDAAPIKASTSGIQPKVPNKEFIYALSDAFTLGFKARRLAPAEQIARNIDRAMRKGQGAASDIAFEAELDKVLALYRFSDDKDVFRTFYHRALAKRLLLGQSASDDFEKGMIQKLKKDYDPEFGMGEDMFKDLALSREMMREYHDKLPRESLGHELTVMVLQRSAWPFSVPKSGIDLPPAMQAELTAFASYYKVKHAQHVLDWDHALGTASLVGRFSPGTKELSVSLYQAIILLLFNDAVNISFLEIKEQVRMDDAELRRTLQSLACGKKRVLKKIPPGRDVNDGDSFRFNPDFDDPRPKVHINSIQAKVSPEESKKTNLAIEGDRKHYLDAAIVRVMKARKELTFEQLKIATIEAVKGHFVPSVDQIKKRIDALVESDYLERSKDDKNRFLYVA
ncbi:hypothetical protein M378DRAFT_188384 [Amanita muscaria Koide BX008]|uniref:Cullin family profile domain-containing protein n=1 Tax=Amanita muscaria (strain Koide BX008) TaxID=946122 RepID=A0A0C2WNB0_AMAMK|nr:hypothetical protein M378DRAFT_188384 [Amanita muscaria Koide BX008]